MNDRDSSGYIPVVLNSRRHRLVLASTHQFGVRLAFAPAPKRRLRPDTRPGLSEDRFRCEIPNCPFTLLILRPALYTPGYLQKSGVFSLSEADEMEIVDVTVLGVPDPRDMLEMSSVHGLELL